MNTKGNKLIMNKTNYDNLIDNREVIEVLKPAEVAEYLRCGKNIVYDLIRSGDLKAFKIGNAYMISKEAVILFIRKQSGMM